MWCRICGLGNPAGADFCGGCGRPLTPVSPNGAGHSTSPSASGAARWDRAHSDTTRYLCAAVQLNSKLAASVIDGILEQPFKPPPSSPDVDLAPVLRHAVAARFRQLLRDVLLAALLLLAVAALLTLQSAVFVLALVLAWVVLFAEQLMATYGVVARHLRPGVFDPAQAPEPGDPRTRQRLLELQAAAQGNVTVYSGYVPFVGSGELIDAWSFVLDVQRAAEGRQCAPFTTAQIHDVVLSRLEQLPLPGLGVEDRLFVDGTDLRGDGRFLPVSLGPPTTAVPPPFLRALIEHPEDVVRPYICVRVPSWGGQLVLSTFVRFVVTPQHLFVELSHSLLPPVREQYQEVDRLLPQPTVRQTTRMALRAAAQTPWSLVRSPGAVLRALTGPVTRSRRFARQRREITQALRFDYGSSQSPREQAADTRFHRYFQKLDRDMHVKVVEKAVLEAMVAFLDDRGIDTSELRQRQTTILNNGVFVSGGATVNAGSMAAGTGAQATSGPARFMEAARAAAPGGKS
jgi:hypothetical protein